MVVVLITEVEVLPQVVVARSGINRDELNKKFLVMTVIPTDQIMLQFYCDQ